MKGKGILSFPADGRFRDGQPPPAPSKGCSGADRLTSPSPSLVRRGDPRTTLVFPLGKGESEGVPFFLFKVSTPELRDGREDLTQY